MFARPIEVLALWTRRTGAVLLAALALARPGVAQSTQSVPTQPGSGIAIQVTNIYSGMPSRGFLPVRVNITNSSNSDGQWEVETMAVVSNNKDNHFGAKAICIVPAQGTRMIEVLAPLPDTATDNPPKVIVHVTGPGVVNPDVTFIQNIQPVPPNALRVQVPYATTTGARITTTARVGTTTIISSDSSGATIRTTTTTRPDGSTTAEALTTRSDGSTQTTITETDPTGRIISRRGTSTPATRPTTPAPTINATTTPSPTVTPTASITRNADGSTTLTSVSTRPDGTTLTVKKTTKPDGSSSSNFTITNAAGSVLQGGPGEGPGNNAPLPASSPTAPRGGGGGGTVVPTPSPAPSAFTGVISGSGKLSFNGNAAGLFGAPPVVAPGDKTDIAFSTDPLTGAPVRTTIIKHPDGTTTTVTATLNKLGTDIVTVSTDASGAKKSTSHELSLSPQVMELALSSSPTGSLAAMQPVNYSLSNRQVLLASVAAAVQPIAASNQPGSGNVTGNGYLTKVDPATLYLSGTTNANMAVFAQAAPAPRATGAGSAGAGRAPPPPPPPPPTVYTGGTTTFSSTGGGTLIISSSPATARGRGTPTRLVNRTPGAAIFIGVSSTLAHDQGEKIKTYYLNTCVRPLQQSALDPNMMSADWRAYLGFDLVFFSAADWLAAAPEIRLALTQWVAAGGELRIISNSDGGLNLPPRLNEHYGAGVIEVFSEDELANYNFTLEHTDPKERALFSLEYRPLATLDPLAAAVGYDVPTGMQAREFTLSLDTLMRTIGLDPYSTAGYTATTIIPAGYTTANSVVAAESMLTELFSRSGASFGAGASVHLNTTTRHLIVINTPAYLDQVAQILARYGETMVIINLPAATAQKSPALSANAPAPVQFGPDSAEMKKMRAIILPSMDINAPTPLDVVVEVLHNLSVRYDSEGKGVNFHVYPPASGDPIPKITLTNLSSMSLADLIKQACAAAQPSYAYGAEGAVIAVRPANSPAPAAGAKTGDAKTEMDVPKFADQMPHLGNRYFVVACVIICFGLLVGPLNLFLFCGGTRRPHLLWVTPLLAIAASVAILGFILLAEGIGGRGIYYRVTQINPDGKFAVESEVESSVTGVLMRHDFDLGELAWVLDYNQAEPGLPMWSHGSFLQAGKHYTGDWFASRREQMLFARAVVPTRASLRVEAVAGKPPVLHSEFNGLMVNLFYQDEDGKYWKIDRMTDGQPTHLQPASGEEYKAAWDENMRSAPKQLATYLRKITPVPGTFFALGTGEASPLEPDFTGLRWNRFRHLITGPVLQ